MVHKLGYGNWDELKSTFRTSPLFRFDWFVKSRTTQELSRRCDTLIRLVEKENQEFDERERQARKEKKAVKVTPCAIFVPFFFFLFTCHMEMAYCLLTLYSYHLMWYFCCQILTPTKRSISRQQAMESPTLSTFKRKKQSLMDDYVGASVCLY